MDAGIIIAVSSVIGGGITLVVTKLFDRKKNKVESDKIVFDGYSQLIENLSEQNENYEQRFKAQNELIQGVLASDRQIIENSNLVMAERKMLLARIEHLEEASKERDRLRAELTEKVTKHIEEKELLQNRITELERRVEELTKQLPQ